MPIKEPEAEAEGIRGIVQTAAVIGFTPYIFPPPTKARRQGIRSWEDGYKLYIHASFLSPYHPTTLPPFRNHTRLPPLTEPLFQYIGNRHGAPRRFAHQLHASVTP
jgi:hypothetical protein